METLEQWLADRRLAPGKAVDIVFRISRQAAHLHTERQQFHGQIQASTIECNGDDGFALADPQERVVVGGSGRWEQWPPELQLDRPITLETSLSAARDTLRSQGVSFDPVRIDIYQLAGLLYQLVSGYSIETYLKSPSVKRTTAPSLAGLLDRAVGFDTLRAYTDVRQWIDDLATLDTAHSREPGEATRPVRVNDAEHEHEADLRASGNTKPHSPGNRDLPFDQLGHYQIVGRLGEGGMGDVYLAYERDLNRYVAIKVLPDELARQEDFVQRFYAEASAAAQLSHPNIVQIYFIGEDGGRHFFAMQYVEGETLGGRLARQGRLSSEETVPLVLQILSGLAMAHARGMIHRDIKPNNILLAGRRALITDFGLVKCLSRDSHITETGIILGTADYIAPEQGRGLAIDTRADLYSLGVMMYRMLSGTLPFEADSPTAMIFQHVYEPPPALAERAPGTPPELVGIVDRLMAKERDHRFSTAGDVIAALRRLQPAQAALRDAEALAHSEIIPAPDFDSVPLPEEDAPKTRWLIKQRHRWLGRMQAFLPRLAERLQTTEQQVEGTLAEYERRRDHLDVLVKEAEAVCDQLSNAVSAHQDAAAAAAQRAAASENEPGVREEALGEERDCTAAAAELVEQLAIQQDHLDTMRVMHANVRSKVAQLRARRDQLAARLKVLEARRSKGRRTRFASWTLRLLLVFCLLVLLVVIAVRRPRVDTTTPSRSETASPVAERPPNQIEPTLPTRQLLAHKDPVTALTFSADGRLIASGGKDGYVHIWDADSGNIAHALKCRFTVRSLAFSPDRELLAAVGTAPLRNQLSIQLWNCRTGTGFHQFSWPPGELSQVAFRSAGKVMVVADDGRRRYRLWDVAQRQEVGFIDFEATTQRALLSADGRVAVCIQPEHGLAVRDLGSNQSSQPVRLDGPVKVAAIMRDGTRLATADRNGTVSIWNVAANVMLSKFSAGEAVSNLCFSPDGRFLAVETPGEIALWHVATREVRKRFTGHDATTMAFSPDGSQMVSGGIDRAVVVWDAILPPLLVSVPEVEKQIGPVHQLSVSRRGQLMLAKDEQIGFFDSRKAEFFNGFPIPWSDSTKVVLSPHGRIAVSADSEGWLQAWSMDKGELLQQAKLPLSGIPRDSPPIGAMTFASDERTVFLRVGKAVVVWDVASNSTASPFPQPLAVLSLAVSGDGTLLATGGGLTEDDSMGDLRLWNAKTGEFIRRLKGHTHYVSSLAFSPNGQYLLSGGRGFIHLWNVDDGQEVRRFRLPPINSRPSNRKPVALAFSRDGRRFISGDFDGVLLWDIELVSPLKHFDANRKRASQITDCRFSLDDRFVIACGEDGFLRVWDTTSAP